MPSRCVWRRVVLGRDTQRVGAVSHTMGAIVVDAVALVSPSRSGGRNDNPASVGVQVPQTSVAAGHRPTCDGQ